MAKTLEKMTLEELDAREAELLDSFDPNVPTAPSGLDIREEELIKSLQADGIDIPVEVAAPVAEETPFTAAQRDEDIIKFMQFPEFAIADPSDIDFNWIRLQENLVARFGTVEPIGFVETMRNTRVQEKLPFVGSLYKFDRLANVFEAARNLTVAPEETVRDVMIPEYHFLPSTKMIPRVKAKDRRTHDIKLMEDWLIELDEKQSRGISIGGRIADGITELPAFMVEFLLTGPLFRTGSAAAKTAATRVLGRFAEKGVSKLAIRVAAAGFGSVLRTAVNVPRIIAGAAENMTEGIIVTDDGAIAFADADVNPFKALSRSFVDLYIENLTEVSGKAIGEGVGFVGGKLVKKFPVLTKFTQELGEKWIANGAAKGITRTAADFLKASATKIGYDGILEEMAEEQLGRMLRVATGLEEFDTILPSMEDLLVEAGIFAVPGGISLATTKIFRTDRPSRPIERDGVKALADLSGVSEEEFRRFIATGVPVVETATPEVLARDRILLFESEKNVALSQEQNVAALEFINERTGVKKIPKKRRPTVIAMLPDDFEEFIEGTMPPTEAKPAIEKKIVDNTVKTKTEGIVANTKEAAVEPVSTIDAIRRNVSRAEDAVGHWGTAGKKVQRDFREISARTAKNVGTTSQNIKPLLKGLSAAEKIVVAQIVDGKIAETGLLIQTQPRRLVERARLLKEQLDIMQREAISVGLRKGKLTGKAFPQVPNKLGEEFLREAEVEGAKSHHMFAWAQNQVNEGKFKTVDSAIAALQNYRKNRLRGTEGYFEGKRLIELDFEMREWNPDTILPGIIEGGWENIEAARQWGVTKDGNFKTIRTSIERIRGEIGQDQANLLEDYIKAQYGQSKASVVATKWSKRARAVQFVGKLAFSPLTITRNMLDRYAKGLTHGTIGTNIRATVEFPPFLNKWMKTSQRIQDEMIRRGAVLGHGHLSEGFAGAGKIQSFLGQPFALSEKGNQTYIAIVKKMQLEADIKRLNELGGEDGTVGKMYNRLLAVVGKSQLQTRSRLLTNLTNEQLVDALGQEKIDDDVMSEVLHRTVTDSAFPLTLASKRMWWGNRPWIQTATQFKVWSADQMRFIYKDVLEYTVATRDPSRLARFMIGTWLAGELYNIARDFLTDKDESLLSTLTDEDGRNPKDISKSVANSLVDGGIVGMLADLTYGLSDWALGPTVGSIESIAARGFAAAVDPATTVDGLKMFLLDDIPAAKQARGVLDRIDRTFFAKHNLTENYAKWRRRSFDFRKKKGDLTELERTIGRVMFSRTKRLPGPRTLSLELISRQVLVGDIEDAADYIVGIVEDTKPEKLKDLRAAFLQSARNNSPLGNMSKEDVPEFAAQFSDAGQAEIESLQRQWQKNYSEAFSIAVKRLKEKDFITKLKQEFEE